MKITATASLWRSSPRPCPRGCCIKSSLQRVQLSLASPVSLFHWISCTVREICQQSECQLMQTSLRPKSPVRSATAIGFHCTCMLLVCLSNPAIALRRLLENAVLGMRKNSKEISDEKITNGNCRNDAVVGFEHRGVNEIECWTCKNSLSCHCRDSRSWRQSTGLDGVSLDEHYNRKRLRTLFDMVCL